MLPVIQVGGIAIQSRGLLVLVGLALALWLAESLARRRGLDGEQIWNIGMVGLVTTLVGARLLYAIENFDLYLAQPPALLSLTVQAMSWGGGVLLGLLAIVLYARRMEIRLDDLADIAAPSGALFWGAAALGAYLSGDAYGSPTTQPWGVFLWGDVRHPVQIYELIAAGITLLALGALWDRAPYRGWIALVAAALIGIGRLLVEGFRGDPALLGEGIRLAQLWALVIAVAALGLLYRNQRRLERE